MIKFPGGSPHPGGVGETAATHRLSSFPLPDATIRGDGGVLSRPPSAATTPPWFAPPPSGPGAGTAVGVGADGALPSVSTPTPIWVRADQVRVGDWHIRGGAPVAVTGHHNADLPHAPVVHLAFGDGTWWTGAPCDHVLIEAHP